MFLKGAAGKDFVKPIKQWDKINFSHIPHTGQDFDVNMPFYQCTCYYIQNGNLCLFFWGPFYQHDLTLIPTWKSNYNHVKVWDEITYPLLHFNGATVEV